MSRITVTETESVPELTYPDRPSLTVPYMVPLGPESTPQEAMEELRREIERFENGLSRHLMLQMLQGMRARELGRDEEHGILWEVSATYGFTILVPIYFEVP